jgi:hypothetical protein
MSNRPLYRPFIEMTRDDRQHYIVAMQVPKEVQPEPLIALTDYTLDYALANKQLRIIRRIAGELLLDLHRTFPDVIQARLKQARP